MHHSDSSLNSPYNQANTKVLTSTLSCYRIRVFCNEFFHGNTALIFPLSEQLDVSLMGSLSLQFPHSEISFIFLNKDQFFIKSFFNSIEIASSIDSIYAAGFVVLNYLHLNLNRICINSSLASVFVNRESFGFELELAKETFSQINLKLPFQTKQLLQNPYDNTLIAIFDKIIDVHDFMPDLTIINKLPNKRLVISARGRKVNFIYRMFNASLNNLSKINTCFSISTLSNYWSTIYKKNIITGLELSDSGAFINSKIYKNISFISGETKLDSIFSINL